MLSCCCFVKKKFCASSAHHKYFTGGLFGRAKIAWRMSARTSPCRSSRTPRVMVGPAQLTSTILPSFCRLRKSGAREAASAKRTLSDAKSASMRERKAAIVCLPSAAKCRWK